MPSDQATRDYLFFMVEKIHQQTKKYEYQGNLTIDSNRLGIPVVKLNEILNSKIAIASIARNIFKIMIPESNRNVDHWNKLSEAVRTKEKLLIGNDHTNSKLYFTIQHFVFILSDFLVRYYGPLQVDPKKIHISLVGCLRNQRGMQKKQQQQKFTTTNVQVDEYDEHVQESSNDIFQHDDLSFE